MDDGFVMDGEVDRFMSEVSPLFPVVRFNEANRISCKITLFTAWNLICKFVFSCPHLSTLHLFVVLGTVGTLSRLRGGIEGMLGFCLFPAS